MLARRSALSAFALPVFLATVLAACGSDDATSSTGGSGTSSVGGGGPTSSSSATGTGGAGGATTTLSGGNSSSTGNGGAGGAVDPGKGLGEACANAADCASGFCADGVCCDTACDGACSACATTFGATKDGTCTMAAVKNAEDAGTCDASNGGCGGECSCDSMGACTKKPLSVTDLVAGGSHTCALFADGSVKCWGNNMSGQLGLGDMNRRGDGAGEMGDKLPFLDLGPGKKVKSIAAGGAHTCAVFTDGSVKCWGSNSSGQLGLGNTIAYGNDSGEMGEFLPPVNVAPGKKVMSLALGAEHTCALLDDGTVKCWGNNDVGQLGLGNTTDRGDNGGEMGDNLPVVNLGTMKKAVAITAGSNHTCALFDDSSVKCWGNNDDGQLGLGNTLSRGDSAGEMGDNLPAVNLGTMKKAAAISAGGARTCALLDDGAVKCWGLNLSGQLGLGDSTDRGDNAGEMGDNLPVLDLGKGKMAKAVDLAGGENHVCALLDDGTGKCWGRNLDGQLGLGDTMSRGNASGEMGDNLPTTNVGTGTAPGLYALGALHTCAVTKAGAVKCWGGNDNGQLGLGDMNRRGDQPNEMGDNLPAVVLLGM